MVEEEVYTVMYTFDRIHWPVATPASFDFYMNHNNLILLFDLLAVVNDVPQPSFRKNFNLL